MRVVVLGAGGSWVSCCWIPDASGLYKLRAVIGGREVRACRHALLTISATAPASVARAPAIPGHQAGETSEAPT